MSEVTGKLRLICAPTHVPSSRSRTLNFVIGVKYESTFYTRDQPRILCIRSFLPDNLHKEPGGAAPSLISRPRFGIWHLNQYLFQMKLKDSGKCQTCPLKEETIRHLLLKCPTQELFRYRIRSKLQKQSVDWRTMISSSASIDLITSGFKK